VSNKAAITTFVLAALFFAVFFIYPIVTTVKGAFVTEGSEFTFSYIIEVFRSEIYREGLVNSLRMAVFSTLLSMVIAIPLAIVSDRFLFPGKSLLSSLVLVPLILPPFVGAIGVKHILGPNGALNSLLSIFGLSDPASPPDWLGENRMLGIVLMNALHLFPILYLNVTAALANLDPALDEAAENLGCTGWRRFLRVTFPLTMPGIFAGATIVFIWSFTELGVPLIFDFTRITSVQIFHGIKDLSGNPFPYALVTVTLFTSFLLFAISRRFFGGENFSTSGRASTGYTARRLPRKWHAYACTAGFVLIVATAVLPHIGVVLVALSPDWYGTVLPDGLTLRHFEDALGHEITLISIKNSLKYATLATLVDLVLGVAIAYIVVRTRLPGRGILDTLSMMPLAVPGLVMAFGYLAMTREGQPLDFLMVGENPLILLVIAYAVRRLPYVVRSAAAGFQQTSPSLEQAAQNLGASPARALRKITLPLISANLIAGGMLAFAFAMIEVSDSLILAQQQAHFPITKAIYGLARSLGNGEHLSAALGTWAMILLGVTITGASILIGKKLGALFRV